MIIDQYQTSLLSSAEAAARIGVKPETLYAYVSRGLLGSRPGPGRRSLFDPSEVERLASRSRPATTPGRVVIRTSLTSIEDGRLLYRGADASELALHHGFEPAAEWLWSGTTDAPRWPWGVASPVEGGTYARRLRAAVAAFDGSALGPVDAARALLAWMIDSLKPIGAEAGGAAAGRLWPRLTRKQATAAQLRALDAALVVMADHEPGRSVLSARLAANAHDDVALAALAGLATLMHRSASERVQELLDQIRRSRSSARAIAQGRPPGFGHPRYPGGDPRAAAILRALGTSPPALRALVGACRDRGEPNAELALGALAHAGEWEPGATDAVVLISRTVGWIAHALEERTRRTPVRVQSIYTGPRAEREPSRTLTSVLDYLGR